MTSDIRSRVERPTSKSFRNQYLKNISSAFKIQQYLHLNRKVKIGRRICGSLDLTYSYRRRFCRHSRVPGRCAREAL